MSYTPFNAPLLAGIFGDPESAAAFSVRADVEAMIRIEKALLESCAASGIIEPQSAQKALAALEDFEPRLEAFTEATARDGVAVPELVRQMREMLEGNAAAAVHFGATSQDIVDTSLILRLRDVNRGFRQRLQQTIERLDHLGRRNSNRRLMAQTRMQQALPLFAADRIALWRNPLDHKLEQLSDVEEELYALQFGGPVGKLEALGEAAHKVREEFARKLGLRSVENCWHTDRTRIVRYAEWLSGLTGALGKMGIDIALMAQNERSEIQLESTGRSSSMPHKSNPVLAESLVTLARYNATQITGIHQAQVHEQERSGAAWALEWMLLPAMVVATGAALRNAEALANSIDRIGEIDD